MFHETYETYGPCRLAANWFWLKHDFLNGGAQYRVSFDDRSRLAVVLKRYYMGIDSVPFLVRDGQQCYLFLFTDADQPVDDARGAGSLPRICRRNVVKLPQPLQKAPTHGRVDGGFRAAAATPNPRPTPNPPSTLDSPHLPA